MVCRVIKESPKGIIIGTTSGILHFIRRQNVYDLPFQMLRVFSNVYVNDVYFDASGIVWVSTESQGLFRYDEGVDSSF
ncbi:MAG: hypothetical protein R2769_02465 [Saprospiraceae bacterium]